MKYFYISLFLFIMLFYSPLTKAQDSLPLTYNALYKADILSNLNGGIKKGNAFLGLIDIGILFNTRNAGWWKGGEAYIQVENTHGDTPSQKLTGDFQTFSNLENGNYTYLYMAWFAQKIGNLKLTAGIHDLNSEFNSSEYAGHFINSSFGIVPTFSMNVPVSIFPKNSLGLVADYTLNENLYIKTAIYDGNPGDLDNDPHNLNHSIKPTDGFLYVAELGISKKGNVKIGSYVHTGKFINISDSTKSANFNPGLYLIIEKKFEVSPKKRTFKSFVQVGWMPSCYNETNYYVGGGLLMDAPFSGRKADVFGISIGHAVFSRESKVFSEKYETVFEWNYELQINNNIQLKPCVQHILNTGGNGLADASIGLLRFQLEF